MKKFILITTFIFIAITFLSGPIYQPPKDLKEYSNKHFTFIYEEDLSYLINQLDNFSIRLYEDYSEFYETEIDNIQVFILDDVDYVNGFSLNMTNQIRLYINRPLDYLGLGGSPNDWIRFVFSHELNHIFYGNTVTDPILSWIPSETIKKSLNMVNQPSLLHEGLSIFMESKYFEGRFSDDLFNTYLFAEILSDKYPRYKLGGGAPTNVWSPAGFNYMYGTLIIKKIEEYYGYETLKNFIFEINSSFFDDISDSFLKSTGVKFSTFLDRIENEYSKEKENLLNEGFSNDFNKIDNSFHNSGNLKTDGKNLYYYKESPDQNYGIYKNNELIKEGISKFDVNSNGEIIYRVSENNNNEQNYSLYHICACDFKDTLIDERVVEFSFVDKNTVVYSKIKDGLTGLFLYNFKNNSRKKLVDYNNMTISSIEGHNSKFYFTMNTNNQSDIYSYNINSGEIYQLTNDKFIERDLFYNDGYLFFSANYNHIYNIHYLNLDNKQITQITKKIPGTFNPVILNNELYYFYYDHNGYHLTSDELDNIDYFTAINTKKYDFDPVDYKNVELNSKNYFEKPTIIPLVNLAINNDQIYFGPDILVIGEAVNYTGEFGFYHNFVDDFIINSYFQFDYIFSNEIFFNYKNNNFNYGYGFNSNNQFNLKDKNTFNYNAQISFKNLSFDEFRIGGILGNTPIKNNYNSGYKNIFQAEYVQQKENFGFLIGYSKDIIHKKLKLTPGINYYKTSLYEVNPNLKFEYDLWKPHYALKDGKYRFDGIDIGAEINYYFMQSKFDYKVSIEMEMALFYWLPVNIPLEYPLNK
ncbi:TolB family protein [Geotoga petraea]|uniref:Peptidase MA superfamily protein n=1 Tax=Geotoga petraea TaxID=28234 RepID=A0A1G6KSH2_9BACT|nr:hypothetical protein [Geotoga petraea]SDC34020.1 hypothetical protein SAMN04488588_0871 [Geotoga petraea]